jgi:exonuclease VII large subunit
MALTDQERARIREEEWVRLQAQEDFNRSRQKLLWSAPRIIAVVSAFAGAALLLLFTLARTH